MGKRYQLVMIKKAQRFKRILLLIESILGSVSKALEVQTSLISQFRMSVWESLHVRLKLTGHLDILSGVFFSTL